jgi:hypothetical protein
LEIENSSGVTAITNQAFDNTLGIIADAMPGLEKTDQTDVVITDNDVHGNNRANTVPSRVEGGARRTRSTVSEGVDWQGGLRPSSLGFVAI